MPSNDSRIIRALTLTAVEADRYCVAVSPYVSGYAPGVVEPPPELVGTLLDNVLATGQVKCILVYGSMGGSASVVRAAAARQLPVLMNVWLDGAPGDQSQIDNGIALAREFPEHIFAISCGSEIRLRHDRSVAVPVISSCLSQFRAARVPQPLTHQATWPEWCNEEFPGEIFPRCERWLPIADLVDFISATVYLFWENTVGVRFPCLPIANAAEFHLGGPEAVIDCPLNIASEANKYAVAASTLGRLYRAGLHGILFSAFNEPWKGPTEGGGVDSFPEWWGFCSGYPPYHCMFPNVSAAVGPGEGSEGRTPEELHGEPAGDSPAPASHAAPIALGAAAAASMILAYICM